MLTRDGAALLSAAVMLLLAGVGLGNDLLTVVAAVPLFTLLTAAALERPTVDVTRTLEPDRPRAGQLVTCTLRVRATGGVGLMEVHQGLPDLFELEEGSNLHLLRKGWGPLDATVRFRVRATKRGEHALPAVDVETADPVGLVAPRETQHLGEAVLDVRPPMGSVSRFRGIQGVARRLFPESDVARMGVETTEFRDIRDYHWGDPPRTVNWKATARRLTSTRPGGGFVPLVNEYEREGKKTVWIFVDAADYVEVGSDVENALEYNVEAATSLARYFLDHGYTLGAYVYNSRGRDLVHPDTGTHQLLKVTEELQRARPGDADEGLRAAVQRCRSFLVQGRPLVVVFTRLAASADDTVDGVKRIRSLGQHRTERLPVLVASPQVASLLEDHLEAGALLPSSGDADPEAARRAARDALTVSEALETAAVRRVRGTGANVLSWDPRRHGFHALFAKGAFH